MAASIQGNDLTVLKDGAAGEDSLEINPQGKVSILKRKIANFTIHQSHGARSVTDDHHTLLIPKRL